MKYCKLWGVSACFFGGSRSSSAKVRRAPYAEGKHVHQGDIIKELCNYFSFPNHEITRLVNCVFHLILKHLRSNARVSINRFGTFHNHWVTGYSNYSIGTGTHASKKKVTYRALPVLSSNAYAMHVLSPKEAFVKPLFIPKNAKKSEWIKDNPLTLPGWYKDNDTFYKRSFMVYDNPYTRTGEWKGHILKESTSNTGLTKSEKEAYELFETHFKSEFIKQNKLVYKRFVLRDLYDPNHIYWCYHNYLPGKYYSGSSFNFEATKKESDEGVNRYDILEKRQRKFQTKLLNRTKEVAELEGEEKAKTINFYCPVNLSKAEQKDLDKINFNFLEQEYGIK